LIAKSALLFLKASSAALPETGFAAMPSIRFAACTFVPQPEMLITPVTRTDMHKITAVHRFVFITISS